MTTTQVFQLVQQGVSDLGSVPGSTVARDEATGATRTLAATMLADAIADRGNPLLIVQAQLKMVDGDAARLAGDYTLAISHYRAAWSLAESAM